MDSGAASGSASIRPLLRIRTYLRRSWTPGHRHGLCSSDFGFRSVSLTASDLVDPDQDRDALRIAAGTNIQARTDVLLLSDTSADVVSARDLTGLATVFSPHELAAGGDGFEIHRCARQRRPFPSASACSVCTPAHRSWPTPDPRSHSPVVGGIEMDGLIRARRLDRNAR